MLKLTRAPHTDVTPISFFNILGHTGEISAGKKISHHRATRRPVEVGARLLKEKGLFVVLGEKAVQALAGGY